MNYLIFDIETVAVEDANLSRAQIEFVNKKLNLLQNNKPINDENLLSTERTKIKSLSPYLGKIICIGLKMLNMDHNGIKSKKEGVLTGDEHEILNRWWNIIKGSGILFISYNGLHFDVPWIIKRSIYHGIRVTNKEFLQTRRFSIYPHFDVCEILADWDRFNYVSLDLACEFFGISSPKNNGVSAENINKFYQKGRIKEISEYCLGDVNATFLLYEKIRQYQPR